MEKDFNGSQPCIGHAKRSLPPNGFNVWKATIDANGMAMDFGDTSVGLSGMAVAGAFTGGEFAIGAKHTLRLQAKCIMFSGQDWHCSLPFEGKCVSIVAFTHNHATLCDPSQRSFLLKLGFPLPRFLR